MAYKKKLNNKDNIRTYCQRNAADKPPYSCSRIDAVGHRVISTQAEEQCKHGGIKRLTFTFSSNLYVEERTIEFHCLSTYTYEVSTA